MKEYSLATWGDLERVADFLGAPPVDVSQPDDHLLRRREVLDRVAKLLHRFACEDLLVGPGAWWHCPLLRVLGIIDGMESCLVDFWLVIGKR